MGIAHVFLLGLLKDFWRLWLRKPSAAADGFIIPQVVRSQMAANGEGIQTTELYSKPYTDIIRYVPFPIAWLQTSNTGMASV